MKRFAVLLMAAALLSGCGTYRIVYRFPSKEAQAEAETVKKSHAHGIGLIGGGGYFFALHQMFPALIDYSGERRISDFCPDGVYEVEHHTEFWHNAGAALISWLIIVNAYHPSEVQFRCVKPPEASPVAQPAGDAAPPTTASPAGIDDVDPPPESAP